uniref:Uncharacterized protein n=1 Tax=Anguilla anguilla TaxID=7936 RepID=A0A0E9SH88_ANGAN
MAPSLTLFHHRNLLQAPCLATICTICGHMVLVICLVGLCRKKIIF